MGVQFYCYDRAAGTRVGDVLDFNTRNAELVLDALGVPVAEGADPWERLYGEVPGEEFLGRVLVAEGLAPADAGLPWATDPERANWHEGSRREGYLQDRLGELHDLAEYAASFGLEVVWQ